MSWEPGTRAKRRALEAPYEDVPEHLALPLRRWVFLSLKTNENASRINRLALVLRMSFERQAYSPDEVLGYLFDEEPTYMLTVAEAQLDLYGDDGGRARVLHSLLREANSAYTVRDDLAGLERVVAPGVKEQVQSVVALAGEGSGGYLADAWNAAYSRSSDGPKSYAASVMAVEAALKPHVSPDNKRQTLGTMIRDVTVKPEKWKFEIGNGDHSDGVQMVLGMMRQLWDRQLRHGTQELPPTSVEEAQAAVHVAAALVQFAVSGAFRPVIQ